VREAALALRHTVMVAAAIAVLAVLGRVAGRDMVPDLEVHHTVVEGDSWKAAATVHMEPEKAVGRRGPVLLEAADRNRAVVADPEGVADIDLADLEEDTVVEMDPSSKAGSVAGPVEDTTAAGSRKERADSVAVPGAHNRRAAEQDSPVAAGPEAPANTEVVQTWFLVRVSILIKCE
jgi:hypothetical protein